MQIIDFKEFGIHTGLIISGLFGSLLTIRSGASAKVGSVMVSIAAGVGSANYITPIVVDLLNITNVNSKYGIAFLLGFLGLRGIEYTIDKFFQVQTKPTKRKTVRRTVRKNIKNPR